MRIAQKMELRQLSFEEGFLMARRCCKKAKNFHVHQIAVFYQRAVLDDFFGEREKKS
jgi:hypothetical protein